LCDQQAQYFATIPSNRFPLQRRPRFKNKLHNLNASLFLASLFLLRHRRYVILDQKSAQSRNSLSVRPPWVWPRTSSPAKLRSPAKCTGSSNRLLCCHGISDCVHLAPNCCG